MRIFFFSSRRRHTRFDCDWSSDVALPISAQHECRCRAPARARQLRGLRTGRHHVTDSPLERNQRRSEEHTSELQSQSNLVCRLLLEKKKKKYQPSFVNTKTSPTSHTAPLP